MADGNEAENISEDEACEDVPSNFFDDFEKEDFLDGLEVIDTLNEDDGREKVQEHKRDSHRSRRSVSDSRLDDYIKPGSRRDPEKTNAAILRDKEVKVKEHLAKHLESQDDLRPPGTELDDFFDEAKPSKIRKKDLVDLKYEISNERYSEPREHDVESPRSRSPRRFPPWRGHRGNWRGAYRGARHFPHYYHRSGHRHSPEYNSRRSPNFVLRHSPHHRPRRSPEHSFRQSPHFRPRHSPRRSPWHSPKRNSRRSPMYNQAHSSRHSPHHSPRRSPRRSPRHTLKREPSYSPRHIQNWDTRSNQQTSRKRSTPNQSPHWSPRRSPKRSPRPSPRRSSRRSPRRSPKGSPRRSPRRSPQRVSSKSEHYKRPSPTRYSPQFSQQQYTSETNPHYVYTFTETYNPYGQPVPPEMGIPQPGPLGMNMLQPGPMPVHPVPAPVLMQPNYMALEPVSMVPPPQMVAPAVPQPSPSQFQPGKEVTAPYDALAQLVAEGKLSQEDYLKLTPSIKGGSNFMDEKTKKSVLARCNQAVNKLIKLSNPFRFYIEDKKLNKELLCLPPKYSSPLKRQITVEFEFTKPGNQSNAQQNKQIINNIITTIGLQKAMLKTVKKETKSVGVQTTKPFCDMCEIRDFTKKCSVGVSTDPLFLTSTVHTQVVEKDLLNSKAIFNPSGSVGDGAPISIAHLTPAQLVSQLAARAKSFQQAESPPPSNQLYPRRKPPNPYDGRGGAHEYNPNYHYRY